MRPVITLRVLCCAILPIAAPVFAWAHEGEAQISPAHLWTAWSWEPFIVLPLAISLALYFAGVVRARKASRQAISAWQILSFFSGWLTLVIALLSPLHKLGSVLFSAHMTQHELLMLIAAPLLVMGKPGLAMLWAFPLQRRRQLGAATRWHPISTGWALLSLPLAVWVIHGTTLWVWHLPSLYQATLHSDLIHALQHSFFLGTAILFWWTLIHGRHGRLAYGAAVAYVFTTALHSSILGALLTFAPHLWYPIYNGRTAPWGITPLEDQQLGGLIMWVPAGVVFVVLGLALFAAWLGESDRRLSHSQLSNLAVSEGHDHAA